MTTTVTKVIGTGGDYSTVQAWEDATPANLVTADQVWRGECKNQTFGTVTFAGTTADATRYSELTTQSGASFRDNVNAQTNALRVNTSNGATLRTTSSYTSVLTWTGDFIKISNLQFEVAGAVGGSSPVIFNNAGSTTVDINNCLIEGNRTNVVALFGINNVIRNSLVVCRGSGVGTIASLKNQAQAINCTFAVPSDKTAATVALTGQYSTATVTNCAIFGASALSSGTAPTYTTCATNITGTTGVTGSVAYSTSTFANVTDATRDFKLVTGSALLDVGTTDSTNAATDVVGTARPQGSAYDIGAWELVTASGNTVSVPAGALTLTGFAPTIVQSANQVVAVPLGTLSLTGQTPTVLSPDPKLIAVPAGSLTLTGFAPTVNVTSGGAPQTISVPAGSLTLTGFAPTIVQTANNVVQVPAGTLTMTGQTPTVLATANNVVSVPLGTLTMSPYAPVVNPVAATVGSVAVVGGGPAPKRRKPHFVEIDGELFPVQDEAEAIAILQQAQELHEEIAEQAVEQKAPPPAKPVLKASPVLKAAVEQAQLEMNARHAEIERAYQQMLDDDDEDVLLLL